MSSDNKTGWRKRRLIECMSAIIDYRGKTPKKTDFGIPLVTAKVIKNGFIETPSEFIAADEYESWMRRGLPQAGDVVLTSEAPLGEVADIEDPKVALAQRVFTLRANPEILNQKFLKYLLMCPETQEQLQARSSGTTVHGIRQSELKEVLLEIPPMPYQVAMAERLGGLERKLRLNREMTHTLEEMSQALFKSWFVDFDPVVAKSEGRKPFGMSDDIAALFPDSFEESELGAVPKGWVTTQMSQVVDWKEGPGLRNWQYRDFGMPFINIRCISQGDINSASANCISLEEFEQKYAHFALEVDDIVISTSGTLGRSAIVRKEHLPLMLNTSVIRMRSRPLGLSFLWCFLNSPGFLDEMAASANGSVQLNFGPIHLRAIRLLVPPAEVLQAFNSICEPLLRRVLSCRSESNILSAARDSLLPVLLSGELAVFEGVHHKEATAA